ncbi:response regulator [Desulfobacula phenolica]|uniref:Anti-anti-sigma factor n=1 Tax=Desulfobacula phenolica TaxID=90732 RepID=A0A1H2HXW8_9BACT|nr:response regulator [Desulfobacula phenolica]SDU36555.1 anti-anti-sigma factor [Desulfobacula phenolica]
MKILVIDDEKPTLSMFKLFLTAYGYEVYTAENGEKGLALFAKISPEIVFTDIKMPGIDGLEVLRRIQKTGIESEVIIITGHGDMEKALEALDLNALDFINKPVERKALNSALARAEKRKLMPRNMPFEFSERKRDGYLSIFMKGRLTASAEKTFISAFKTGSFDDVRAVCLKLDDAFFIDRSGISLLMEVVRNLKQNKISIIIENLSCNYVRVFQMAGIDKMATLKEAQQNE